MQTSFDIPYAIFYTILLYLAYNVWKYKRKKYIYSTIMVTFAFVAFRAPVVGADTWNYVRYLTGERSFYNYDIRELEPLFILYRTIVNDITDSRLLVMVINTVVSMSPVFYMIKKYSLNAPLSILMFFYLGCTNLYFVGLRQIIGFSFICWALLLVLYANEKKIKTLTIPMKLGIMLLAIIIAYFFHTSNILYGVLVFCAIIIPIKSKHVALFIIGGSALFGVVLSKFDAYSFFQYLYLLDIKSIDRISPYLINGELEAEAPLNILLRLTFLSSITLVLMDERDINHPFVKLFIMGGYFLIYFIPYRWRADFFLYFSCSDALFSHGFLETII